MYIIMEIQVYPDGGISTPCYAYTDKNKAEQKYHAVLSAAAVSSLLVHTCFMLTPDGYCIKSECYKHEPEPEPEPEPEEESNEG